jgi:hypothetical protein
MLADVILVQNGRAIDRVKNLLSAIDERLRFGGILPADLRAHFVLERAQLADRGVEVAAVK